jgi:asparagine synthase (glutamine-hydrolysing)
MSGIVGIIHADGAPVDQELLERMTTSLSYRGPDAWNTWIAGPAGFGHTLLRTTFESEHEQQPCSLDGQVWITADARIDGRDDLINKLADKKCAVSKTITDVELILHAYHVWGEDCVKHLIGDFAFAIWDGCRQQLFCARDHFGIKPFFYAKLGSLLIFSNTLSCLRIHPDVSSKLNDLFIGDFLVFGYSQESDATAYQDINRLPPAHYLIYTKEKLRIAPYWNLPTDDTIRYRRAESYVEHFQELLSTAVKDRLRTPRLGILMSGGLDSTNIAATACELLKQEPSFELAAYTTIAERIMHHEEKYYAGLVADTLRIPIHYLSVDNDVMFDRWEQPQYQEGEPIVSPTMAAGNDKFSAIAAYSRVVFVGEGGDPLMRSSAHYVADLLSRFRWLQVFRDTFFCLRIHGRLPPLGIRSRLKQRLGMNSHYRSSYPNWLNPHFEKRFALRTRWEELTTPQLPEHPNRPEAYEGIRGPLWLYMYERCDPGITRLPLEVRYPYFDVRLVKDVLAMPPVPWFINKQLLRTNGRGKLPELVLRRPKTVSPHYPHYRVSPYCNETRIRQLYALPALAEYIDVGAVPNPTQNWEHRNKFDFDQLRLDFHVLSLAHYLEARTREQSLIVN